jgi:hypothetical protein
MDRLADHRYTRETVRQFNQDAQKALTEMQELRVTVEAGARV